LKKELNSSIEIFLKDKGLGTFDPPRKIDAPKLEMPNIEMELPGVPGKLGDIPAIPN